MNHIREKYPLLAVLQRRKRVDSTATRFLKIIQQTFFFLLFHLFIILICLFLSWMCRITVNGSIYLGEQEWKRLGLIPWWEAAHRGRGRHSQTRRLRQLWLLCGPRRKVRTVPPKYSWFTLRWEQYSLYNTIYLPRGVRGTRSAVLYIVKPHVDFTSLSVLE